MKKFFVESIKYSGFVLLGISVVMMINDGLFQPITNPVTVYIAIFGGLFLLLYMVIKSERK